MKEDGRYVKDCEEQVFFFQKEGKGRKHDRKGQTLAHGIERVPVKQKEEAGPAQSDGTPAPVVPQSCHGKTADDQSSHQIKQVGIVGKSGDRISQPFVEKVDLRLGAQKGTESARITGTPEDIVSVGRNVCPHRIVPGARQDNGKGDGQAAEQNSCKPAPPAGPLSRGADQYGY